MLSVLLASALAGQATTLANLDFSESLTGWEGEGFAVLSRPEKSATQTPLVWSHDSVTSTKKALLHRGFIVPEGTGVISFRAAAVRGPGPEGQDRLNVVLLAAGKKVIPKEIRTDRGWQETATLLPATNEAPYEYIWRVSDYAGKGVRIVLYDEDDRPGCYLSCSGFQLIRQDEFEDRDFTQFMTGLIRKHKLLPAVRYDTSHFMALSNADERFTEARLQNCELMYRLFYDHFRRKGFALREPGAKLMLALFDNPKGLEAYLGAKRPPGLTGLYHLGSNRFIMYDYGQNDSFLASKQDAEKAGQRIGVQMDRLGYLDRVQFRAAEIRGNANVATVMHEVAHQLSFNCGMLNVRGDLPMWLCEGMACYCEATSNGTWQGIGEPNPDRLLSLAEGLRTHQNLLSLKELVESDQWLLRDPKDEAAVLTGYAQSWALFRMLMEQRPQALQGYLSVTYARQTSDRRLADFEQAFGSLVGMQRTYQQYLERLVGQYSPVRSRSHP